MAIGYPLVVESDINLLLDQSKVAYPIKIY